MAFAINSAYTLPEIMRSKAPDGSAMHVIDVLSQNVPMVEEGYWERANGDTTHEMLRAVTEPTGTLVRYNEGTPNSVATTVPISEPLCRIEDRLQIDTRILEKAPDPVGYRREREAMHSRGLIKTFHNVVFSKPDGGVYGDRGKDLKSIDGLGKRYGAVAAGSVKSNGGAVASSMASIWIVKHGPNGLMFTYPKTMSRTLTVTDMREQPAFDATGNRYEVVMTKFGWEFGLAITDPRAVKRLANITVSGIATDFGGADGTVVTAENSLIDLIEDLPMGDTSGVAIYVGPKVMASFRKRLNSKGNLFFTTEDVWGRKQLTFQGIPIIRVDTLAADEATVV